MGQGISIRSLAAGISFVLLSMPCSVAAEPNVHTVDGILSAYATALGGQTALANIKTRQLTASQHHRSSKLFWQSPDLVLRESRREREGYDGSSAWYETKRKRIQKLPRSRQDEIQTDANPLRFVHLKEMYSDLKVETSGAGTNMDVIAAPNPLGATKFFFDRSSHLLIRIEEFGVNSAYFKQTTELMDYRSLDGIQLPRRIVRTSNEPGAEKGDVHLSDVKQNVSLDPAIFRKPVLDKVVSGGKH